ncbi:PDZ domain-containing protein [bacterium]|nr:PDZ domain-containing protein [bacterium]MBT4251051.1 PDZ domain-containing protein [bacterium]MBT4597956.1 PDZ domain-containing protein [bacterium]MBT6753475.1 PDZ domain-containing protein [bacterium]MBT7037998.1 PDZ domain-containing protein [bacterium]
MKNFIKITALVLLIVVLGGLSGVFMDGFLMPYLSSKDSFNKWSFFKKVNNNVTVINKTEQIVVKEDFSVVKTAQNVLPSVVKIVSYPENSNKKTEGFQEIKTSKDLSRSIKTGLIITNDGLIASVKKRDSRQNQPEEILRYKILLSDDREFDAELIFSDEYSELEFFKAKQENLPTPTFGNSRELESGEKVIVIGNTGGEYQNSFSLGVVNEIDGTFTLLNSQLSSSEKIEGAILTDAKIDEKNIGGPVLDFNGTVVGIANSIVKDGKTEGFIMPINKIKSTIDKIVKSKQVKRATFGVYYLSIDKEISLLSDLPVTKGALIYSFSGQQGLAVRRDSAADLAGIMINDIILSVNGTEITIEKPLANLISEFNPGEVIKLKILRGEEMEIEVILK